MLFGAAASELTGAHLAAGRQLFRSGLAAEVVDAKLLIKFSILGCR